MIALTDHHWLVFNDAREITGCHCGFKAENDQDCGWGDGTIKHLMELAWDQGWDGADEGTRNTDIESEYHYARENNPYADPIRWDVIEEAAHERVMGRGARWCHICEDMEPASHTHLSALDKH